MQTLDLERSSFVCEIAGRRCLFSAWWTFPASKIQICHFSLKFSVPGTGPGRLSGTAPAGSDYTGSPARCFESRHGPGTGPGRGPGSCFFRCCKKRVSRPVSVRFPERLRDGQGLGPPSTSSFPGTRTGMAPGARPAAPGRLPAASRRGSRRFPGRLPARARQLPASEGDFLLHYQKYGRRRPPCGGRQV